eukprot:TRINITY_DN4843_c0_g1_i1.p1 TRINITY_DN4843_c0_g1~~TRINITY_DN4843_c0_g1_i1.p1  ORF type:complete len:1086 (+),score=271.62 TRINITY_DN4843_c0_g1_i1:80-3259(+)
MPSSSDGRRSPTGCTRASSNATGSPRASTAHTTLQVPEVGSTRRTSQEQAERRYRKLYKASHPEGAPRGAITAGRLAWALRSEDAAITGAQAQELLSHMDPQGTGHVTLATFAHVLQAREAQHNAAGSSDGQGDEEQGAEPAEVMAARKRIEKAQRGPGPAVRPDATVRSAVDTALLTVGAYYGIVVLLGDIGRISDERPFAVVEWTGTLILCAGIVANFLTARVRGHLVVFDLREIARCYLRTWFLFDVAAAAPFDLIAWHLDLRAAYRALHHLRLLSFFRLPSLFSLSSPGTMSPTYINWFFRVVPVVRQVTYISVVLHWLSCAFVAMNPDLEYIEGFYWVLYTITTVGYGDIPVDGDSSRLFACLLFLFGVICQGVLVGQLTVAVMQGDLQGDRNARMHQTMAVLGHFAVPASIQEEILGYQYHALQSNLGATFAQLVEALPQSMQDQVGLFMRMRFICQVPMFASSETQVQVALAQILRNIVVPPDTPVVIVGEVGEDMFFVCYGFLDVLIPTAEEPLGGLRVATICKGGFFGENGLIRAAQRTATVLTLTFVDLFALEKQEFDQLARRTPSLSEMIGREVAERDERQREAARGDKRAELPAARVWQPDQESSSSAGSVPHSSPAPIFAAPPVASSELHALSPGGFAAAFGFTELTSPQRVDTQPLEFPSSPAINAPEGGFVAQLASPGSSQDRPRGPDSLEGSCSKRERVTWEEAEFASHKLREEQGLPSPRENHHNHRLSGGSACGLAPRQESTASLFGTGGVRRVHSAAFPSRGLSWTRRHSGAGSSQNEAAVLARNFAAGGGWFRRPSAPGRFQRLSACSHTSHDASPRGAPLGASTAVTPGAVPLLPVGPRGRRESRISGFVAGQLQQQQQQQQQQQPQQQQLAALVDSLAYHVEVGHKQAARKLANFVSQREANEELLAGAIGSAMTRIEDIAAVLEELHSHREEPDARRRFTEGADPFDPGGDAEGAEGLLGGELGQASPKGGRKAAGRMSQPSPTHAGRRSSPRRSSLVTPDCGGADASRARMREAGRIGNILDMKRASKTPPGKQK